MGIYGVKCLWQGSICEDIFDDSSFARGVRIYLITVLLQGAICEDILDERSVSRVEL